MLKDWPTRREIEELSAEPVDFTGTYVDIDTEDQFHLSQTGGVLTVRCKTIDIIKEGKVYSNRVSIEDMVGEVKFNVIKWHDAKTRVHVSTWLQNAKCMTCDFKITGDYPDHCCKQCYMQTDFHDETCQRREFLVEDGDDEENHVFQTVRRGFHPILITPGAYEIAMQIESLRSSFVSSLKDASSPTEPWVAQLLFTLGELYFKLGKLREAEEALKQCQHIQLNTIGFYRIEHAATQSVLGMLYKNFSDSDEAMENEHFRLDCMKSSVRHFRTSITSIEHLGCTSILQRRNCSPHKTSMPHELVFLYSQLGIMEMKCKEQTSAISHYKVAVDIMEDNPKLKEHEYIVYSHMLMELGRWAATRGQLELAWTNFLRAEAVRKRHVLPLWRVRLCLGVVSARQGHNVAIEYFRQAYDEQRKHDCPELPYVLINLCYWYAARQEMHTAEKYLNEAADEIKKNRIERDTVLLQRMQRTQTLLSAGLLGSRDFVAGLTEGIDQDTMGWTMPPDEVDLHGHHTSFLYLMQGVEMGPLETTVDEEDAALQPDAPAEEPPYISGANCTTGCAQS